MPIRWIVSHFVTILKLGDKSIMLNRTATLCFFCEFRAHIAPPHAKFHKAYLPGLWQPVFEHISPHQAVQ
jgi:hypothetical protein